MKTTTPFLIFTLLAATMIAPSASAAVPTLDGDGIIPHCPTPVIDRLVCILRQIPSPIVPFVLDETMYHLGVAVGIVVAECNHLTGACPLLVVADADGASYPTLA